MTQWSPKKIYLAVFKSHTGDKRKNNIERRQRIVIKHNNNRLNCLANIKNDEVKRTGSAVLCATCGEVYDWNNRRRQVLCRWRKVVAELYVVSAIGFRKRVLLAFSFRTRVFRGMSWQNGCHCFFLILGTYVNVVSFAKRKSLTVSAVHL